MNCDITYQELAALAAGDVSDERREELREHLAACAVCTERLAALGEVDAVLRALPPVAASASVILAARRVLSEVTRGARTPEIMTLPEAAEFLRITPEQLGEIVEELPAFELAGQIRIRREKLIEWIQQRERNYTRQAAASWAARSAPSKLSIGAA